MSENEEFEFRLRLEKEQGAPAVHAQAAKPFDRGDIPLPVIGASPNQVQSFAGAVGKGVGTVALGAQDIVGRGLEAAGGVGQAPTISDLVSPRAPNVVQQAGRWLQKDAQAGRAGMEGEIAPMRERNPLAVGAGELTGEIAATAPVGGGIARLVGAVPGVAAAVPNLLNAIRTGGMEGGNALLRMIGGGVTGGASAGLVNPDQAGAGATVGAALPGALQVAGKAGNALGRVIRGPEQAPDLTAAIKAARDAGYVIPPSQANPTLANRALEGFAGKLTTAQNASAKNAATTNAKAATALGLPAETKITPEVLADVRATAGRSYAELGNVGVIAPGEAYAAALNKIAEPYKLAAEAFPGGAASPVLELVESLRSPAFASASAVEKIKQLRTAADDAFRTGNTDVARASKSAAKAIEDAMEEHLQRIGEPERLQAFRDARELIAKSYSVEKALNKETGTVDARKLAAQLQRGKPLSDGLKEAASFAARFPKAAQTPEGMGSLPGTSPLDWGLASGMSIGTGNPLMLAGAAARPAARAVVLSPFVQNRLQQMARQQGQGVNPLLAQTGYRAAPLLATDR